MYIAGLGGSYFDHGFWRTSFRLVSHCDVDRLRTSGVPYVEIDDALGCGLADDKTPSSNSRLNLVERTGQNKGPRLAKMPRRSQRSYSPPGFAEYERASRTVSRATAVVRDLFNAGRLGNDVPVRDALRLVDEIDQMFARGENVLLDVVRLKAEDQDTYLHSVAVCALMVKFARHLAMPEAEVRECGLGGLLHDVGKIRIPATVLHKCGALSPEEFELVKSHAAEGFSILERVSVLSDAVRDVARLHHEKIDGSGYPLGLTGEQIPLLARMTAICDVYDALTSNRSYKKAWAPADAIAKMMASTGHFDEELLYAFAECINCPLPEPATEPAKCAGPLNPRR